jgi:hypothetical protein
MSGPRLAVICFVCGRHFTPTAFAEHGCPEKALIVTDAEIDALVDAWNTLTDPAANNNATTTPKT